MAGSKGGKSVSSLQVFVQSIAQRKICSPSCPIYERCPGMPLSYDLPSHYCQLKKLSPEHKRKLYRLFFNDKQGLIDEITTMVFRHGRYTDKITEKVQDPRLVAADARLMMEFYQLLYGTKHEVTGQFEVENRADPEILRKVGKVIAEERAKQANPDADRQ